MAREAEPSFNPVDVRLPGEEQVFAFRWELLRRNKQFEAESQRANAPA